MLRWSVFLHMGLLIHVGFNRLALGLGFWRV